MSKCQREKSALAGRYPSRQIRWELRTYNGNMIPNTTSHRVSGKVMRTKAKQPPAGTPCET